MSYSMLRKSDIFVILFCTEYYLKYVSNSLHDFNKEEHDAIAHNYVMHTQIYKNTSRPDSKYVLTNFVTYNLTFKFFIKVFYF